MLELSGNDGVPELGDDGRVFTEEYVDGGLLALFVRAAQLVMIIVFFPTLAVAVHVAVKHRALEQVPNSRDILENVLLDCCVPFHHPNGWMLGCS